jgi:PLP dependent protein
MNEYEVEQFKTREAHLLASIKQACEKVGRDPADVQIIWVSKTHPISAVQAAYQAGARVFGENKVQEAVQKFSDPLPQAQLHIIGPVQSNKMRKAVQTAQVIQTVSRYKDLERLQHICEEEGKSIQVLIQVNTSREASKSGVAMEEIRDFLKNIPSHSNLLYSGLMTIGVHSGDPEHSRSGFSFLKGIRDEFLGSNDKFKSFTELSMGMTGDLHIAVEEGATMVRIGTALFGVRDYSRG